MMPCGGRVSALPQTVQGFDSTDRPQRVPVVPDLGAGPADVGVGEKVEGGKVAGVSDGCGEGADDVGVGEVFLLGHLGR